MLKKLRLKFVGSAMGAIALVLLAIVGGINLRNYIQITENACRSLPTTAEDSPIVFRSAKGLWKRKQKFRRATKQAGAAGKAEREPKTQWIRMTGRDI